MTTSAREAPTPRLFGILVTYRRPDVLTQHLGRLRSQTRQLDRLVVVDNAPDPANERAVHEHGSSGLACAYVPLPSNVGPAGGVAAGFESLEAFAADDDWVVLLDDDNPPHDANAIEAMRSFALERLQVDPSVAGVGATGSRWDERRARLVRLGDDELHGPVKVDHIGGGHLPTYRVGAVRAVGGYDPALFWGYEELEFCLRLEDAGYSLWIDGDEARAKRAQHGRLGGSFGRPTIGLSLAPWRRYYTQRNLVHLLRERGHSFTAARVAIVRGIGKALVNGARHPRGASTSVRLAVRAASDGWRGELGRSVEPS